MVHSQVSPSLQRVVGLSVSLLVSKTTSHSVESFTVQHLSWKMLMMEKGEAFNKFGQGDLVHTGKAPPPVNEDHPAYSHPPVWPPYCVEC